MLSRIHHFSYHFYVVKLYANFSATKIHFCFQNGNNIYVENNSTFYHLVARYGEKSRELSIY